MKNGKNVQYSQKALDKSLKLLVKTSFIVFIGLILSKLLGYTYRVLIARYYGPEVYGLFTLALTIAGFFALIASFGLTEGLLRYIPLLRANKKHDEIRYLLRFTLKFFIISSLFISLVLFFAAGYISTSIFHNPDLGILLKIFSFVFIFLSFNGAFLIVLKGFEEISSYSFIFNIFQNVARVGVLGLLILFSISSGSILVTLSFVISTILTLVVSYLFVKSKIKGIFNKPNLSKGYGSLKREFIFYSWPIVFYSVISSIFYMVDSFSLGFYKSAIEVGFYNAAVPIAMLLGLVPELFMQLFFPMITKEYSRGNIKLIQQLSKQVTKWIFIAILPIFVLVFSFPGAALNILFGSEYLVAESALRILLVGTFISALFTVSNSLISMIGKSKLILVNMAFAALLNLVLNSILVPIPQIFGLSNLNGLTGAALSTLISLVFLNGLFLIQTRKYLLFVPLRRKMLPIALASIISALVLFFLISFIPINMLSIVVLSLFFVLSYIALLLIFNSLDKNDWGIIRAVWRKLFKR